MNNIMMSSDVYTVTKILKDTKSKFFGEVKEGHRLVFSVPLKYAGITRGRSYAVDIKVDNLSNDTYTFKTFNQMANLISNFKLEVL